ncbi:MAG: Ig-like domain-containing protein [Planctomycetota bacterium]
MMRFTTILLLLLASVHAGRAVGQTEKHGIRITPLTSGVEASFRGMAIREHREAWIAGSNGTVIRTTDSGESWQRVSVPDAIELDFRDVELLRDGTALLMSVGEGSSSRVLRSTNAGETWQTVLVNAETQGFFDGMTFGEDGRSGWLYGDPVDGHLDIYRTTNGGESWERLPKEQRPRLQEGEYGFAASGTGIIANGRHVWIATGGSVANVWHSADTGMTWQPHDTGLRCGNPTSGIFSIDLIDSRAACVIGGNYAEPGLDRDNVAVSSDGGKTWSNPRHALMPHKACVQSLGSGRLLTCGRTGVAFSEDAGHTWQTLTSDGYYTLRADLKSGSGFLAGSGGRLARFEFAIADEGNLDRFGGFKPLKSDATGFFRTEMFEDRHYFVTPEGHGYRALGINHFHNMTSTAYDETVARIRSWGFNAGCYQGPRWMWTRYPYTKGINLVPVCVWKPDHQFGYRDVFDEQVLKRMEAEVQAIVEPQAENPMLIGYFWTDIPIWERDRDGGWVRFYKSLPKDSAGRRAWDKWKQANEDAPERDFLPVIAKQLYAKGHEFVRRYDPNHMIFGDRYHEVDMPADVVREALPYIDAIAVQPTSREFNFDFFDHVYAEFGKPLYIADHVSSFPTEEYPVTMGKAAENPQDYEAYYRRYVTTAMSRPYMVGFNKCQYQDQPTPSLLKQGLVRVSGRPYEIIERVKDANFTALSHAYDGTEPKSLAAATVGLDGARSGRGETPTILAPKDGARISVGKDIDIEATVDLAKIGGRQVRFYYVDEGKWKPIGHDDSFPYRTTWTSPPPGDWTIYAAAHGRDWKIVSKSKVNIKIVDELQAENPK